MPAKVTALELLSADGINNMVDSAMEELKVKLKANAHETRASVKQLIDKASAREAAVSEREKAVNTREMTLLTREAHLNDRERHLNAREEEFDTQQRGPRTLNATMAGTLEIQQLELQREALV
jgi:hypothetical protein